MTLALPVDTPPMRKARGAFFTPEPVAREESYGDANNLRSRYPQAALGFVLRASLHRVRQDRAEGALVDRPVGKARS